MAIKFEIKKKLPNSLGRAGEINTLHGVIKTPAFFVVGTKATVKAMTPEMLKDTGAQVMLCNTYHLNLQPGSSLISRLGGLHPFSGWSGPMMTDSGGFQVFSLGEAFGKNITKFAKGDDSEQEVIDVSMKAKVTDDGVTFKSHIDGSTHFISPEDSIRIQHELGADIIVAFDEPTSPKADYNYQVEALERTHAWAKRCVEYHDKKSNGAQGLYGVVQGGQYEDLRKKSAEFTKSLNFEGFGIGGSFNENDVGTAVRWVNEILPEDKPRHLLGIGEPRDIFEGVLNGCDSFDCVTPTRNARNGAVFTNDGRINLLNACYKNDFSAIDSECGCYTCKKFSKAYLAHLFKSKEILGATLASIHNVYFLVNFVEKIRQSILDDSFYEFKESFMKRFYK